jgi:hypothetical protein
MAFFDQALSVVQRPKTVEGAVDGRFWSRRQPVMRNHLVVKGGMFPHQVEWWELKNFIKILVGGYGAGKTLIGSKRIISNALNNAPCPVAVVSPTFGIARQTVIRTITELLEGKRTLLGASFKWRFNKSSHEFSIYYHGRTALILIYSGENPLSLRGPNLASAYIDEPFLQDQDVFEQMIARVRHPHAVCREILLTGTPEQLNWGYDLCEGELRERHDVGFVKASTRLNLSLDPTYVERLTKAFSDRAASAFVDGNFENLSEGTVYHAFNRFDNVNVEDIPDGATLGMGTDFNVNPMASIAFWYKGEHIHFFKEYELPNADTEFATQVWREDFPTLVKVFPDASGGSRHTSSPEGKSDFWYIKKAGFDIYAPSHNPKRRDRYNAVNGKLKARDGSVTLTVDPSCKKLIKYLSVHTYELMVKQERFTHLLDAFSYPVSYLFPVAKEFLNVKVTGF